MAVNIKKIFHISRALYNALRQYKWKFSLIILLGFLMGLSGAFGIGTLIPIFYLLTGQQATGIDFITRTIKETLNFLHVPFTLPAILLLAAILFALKGIIQFIAKYYNEKIYAEYTNSQRIQLLKKTLRASWPYLINQKLGYLERVLMGDVSAISSVISQISSLILISTSFIIYIFVAFKISPLVTIITSLFGAVLFITFFPILRKLKNLHRNIRDTEKQVAHFINENITGAKIIKTSAVEEKVILRGEIYFQRYRDDHLKIAIYNSSIGAGFEPVSFAFVALLILFNYRSPSFQIASFAVIIYLIQKIFSFIQTGQSSIQSIVSNIPYMQSIAKYRREIVLNKESRRGNRFRFQNTIEFKNVKFSYNQDKEVLSDINFTLEKGRIIGLIGPSGEGKTTIADLLMRLYRPEGGEILIDDKNIEDMNVRSWRKNIGYMPQDTFLLNDTIENNIRFYNQSLTEARVIKAIKMANIYDFTQELPEGLKTIIGERGVKVSAGQRQRIMLARTLVHNPKIIIFDEATSALDNESELMIQKTIQGLRGKVTLLVIAHRLSTIMKSDKLLVLESGKIVEEGPPDKLLSNKDSHFYKIYNILN